MSAADRVQCTPAKEGNPFEELNPKESRKRKQIDFASSAIIESIETQHVSASPSFKKSKEMPACRSPSLLRKATLQVSGAETPMDTNPVPVPSDGATGGASSVGGPKAGHTGPALIDPGFLEKMDKKMDLLTSGMMSISSRVDEQGKRIGENAAALAAQ